MVKDVAYDEKLKNEWIEIFIKEIKKNNVFEKYMSVSEIKNKLQSIVNYVEYGEADKERSGYWNRIEKYVRISKEKNVKTNGKRVLIHELIHALTTNENSQSGVIKNEKYRAFNEGAVEWLTNKILPDDEHKYTSKGITFNTQGTYPFEQIQIRQLAALYGDEVIIDAIMKNDINKVREVVKEPEAFDEFVFLFDHINELKINISAMRNGRKTNELTEEEKTRIDRSENFICTNFKQAQSIFLEKILMSEIKDTINSRDINKLQELKLKMRKLNELKIHINGEKNINYEKYNILFIKEYLKVVNNGKKPDEEIKFDDVEKYIIGEEKKRKGKKIFSNFINKENKFIPILRGGEETIYIKESGKENICGEVINSYEYLTEEEYKAYLNGNKEYRPKILKGKINLKKISKDIEYGRKIGENLLSQEIIEERELNYGGYIGETLDYESKSVSSHNLKIEERFKENIEAIPIRNNNGTKYLVEMPYFKEIGDKKIFCYKYLTRQELEEYRKDLGNIVIGKKEKLDVRDSNTFFIDMLNVDLIKTNNKYREYVEKVFFDEKRIKECNEKYKGYLGGALGIGDVFEEFFDPKIVETLNKDISSGEKHRAVPKNYLTKKREAQRLSNITH